MKRDAEGGPGFENAPEVAFLCSCSQYSRLVMVPFGLGFAILAVAGLLQRGQIGCFAE